MLSRKIIVDPDSDYAENLIIISISNNLMKIYQQLSE